IFAAKFKVGHIQAYKGSYAGIPINRTLYAGGSNSVRGWSSNQLVPKENKLIEGLQDKGGTFLLESSVEYRYRFLENVGTALFFDVGNTWLGYQQFRFDEIAQAIGFGFRYYTEVAPFRIDFGFKFYDPDVKKYIWDTWDKRFFKNFQFHFGIGEAF
ncbi:MAG: BamA/TamA family outer membrane protein, partial [Ignavibacteriaceae bacterium]